MYSSRSPAGRGPYARAAALPVPSLLGQVLGITGVGFLITALAAYLFRDISRGVGWIPAIGAFLLIFAMQALRRQPAVALLVFYAFAFLEGIFIAPIISAYVGAYGPGVVINAAGTTGCGMLTLAGVAFVFSVDWRRFSGIAMGLLVALVVVGIISIFTHWLQPTTMSWLTLGVFTLLTLVDFSRIRAGGNGLTAVDMALAIYLDALNIFLALLQLFGARSRDD